MVQTDDSVRTNLAVMDTKLNFLTDQVREVNQKVGSDYVTKEEYQNSLRRIKLLEKIVYGAVSIILIAVFGGLMSLVVNR